MTAASFPEPSDPFASVVDCEHVEEDYIEGRGWVCVECGSSDAANRQEIEATRSPGLEYGTDRPCEIGRLTYTAGVHRYVALTFRYTDDDSPWVLTWIGQDGTYDAAQLPEGVYPSAAMLAALATAPVEEVPA